MHRTVPTRKNYPALNVSGAAVGKPSKDARYITKSIESNLGPHLVRLMTMNHCLLCLCFPICKMGIMNTFFIITSRGVMKLYMQNTLTSSEERVSIKSKHSSDYRTIMSSWNCVLGTVLLPLKKKKNSSRERKQTRMSSSWLHLPHQKTDTVQRS